MLPSHAGHMAMETVFGQVLALWLEKQDEQHPLESDMTGLKMSRGTITFTYSALDFLAESHVSSFPKLG